MPVLTSYNQFSATHWETGTVHHFFAHRGVRAPHTGERYSEPFFMGVSGGVVMGYFAFTYKGVPPMARILTRNTFDPWDTMLSRLGVVQEVQHTAKADKAYATLRQTLAEGVPAIVWADMYSLPYNAALEMENMWAMMPILVYGVDEATDAVYIADRSRAPLQVTTAELAAARARVKKEKHRLITLLPPQEEKLATAVQLGIWDCIKLYTEKPPKGSRNNFGLQALEHWATLLRKPKSRNSWAKLFAPGADMLAGLTSAYSDINHFGKNSPAERDQYAIFLEEAALILDKPDLRAAAETFRRSGEAWRRFSLALLPDAIPAFRAVRENLDRQHALFREQGGGAREEIQALVGALRELETAVAADFPLDAAAVTRFREELADSLLEIRGIEETAVNEMKEAMHDS